MNKEVLQTPVKKTIEESIHFQSQKQKILRNILMLMQM